jgi:Carboxypeptidase regulatory-like domain
VSKFITIFVFSFLSLTVFGQQTDNAIVVGTIVDPSKAAIAGATIRLTHIATNAVTEIHSDERGQYRTPPLRIGEYTFSVDAPGFKVLNQHSVVLELGDVRKLDAELQIGQASESVSVESSSPLLQTADATVGTVINNQQIENLPLNGRDYLQLAALSSGTIPSVAGVTNGVTGTPVGVSIGGQAGTAAAFLLDGIDNNSQTILPTHGNQKEVIKPSVDAIQEFKVVTNGYSAEFGRSSSGVVSVSIKSGTNQLHGTAYEFLRNDSLDAKNYFATSKSPFKRNDFGASAGGRVIRDKLFIFGDFELAKVRQSSIQVDTVPTLAERSGDFSNLRDAKGNLIKIFDPKTGLPFANNQIPVTRLDPVAAKVLGWYPLPQTSAATNNYVFASPQNQDPRHWDLRADEIISDKQNLFFRYSSQTQDYGVVSAFPANPQVGNVAAAGGSTVDSHGFAFGYNKIWTPNLVSSVHAGWNYLLFYQYYGNDQNLSTLAGIPGVNQSYPGLANMTLTGFTPLGVTNTPNTSSSQDRQLSGDLTWSKGTQNIKVGVVANWLQTYFLSSQQVGGIFNFTGQLTQNQTSQTGGNAFADFYLGTAASESLSDVAYLNFRTPFTQFFVQDDWRVTRRLTLNLGLRYELNMPPVEKDNKIANFDIDTNPANPQLILPQGGSRANRALVGTDYHQFAPRFGFAYSLPDNKTVLRGGYGIFYSNLTTSGGMQSMEINPPNHIRVNLSTSLTNPTLFLSQGFPASTLSPAFAKSVQLVSTDRNGEWPLAQQWNFNIQRELPGGLLAEIGYYGNKLDHAFRQFDGNPAALLAGNPNSNRRYSSVLVPGTPYNITLADVVRIQKDAYSRYNALQAKIERRYAKGLTIIASYAWSKSIALGDTNNLQNPSNWAAERAVSVQDMTQHFVGSAVYELPFGRGKAFGAHWNAITNGFLGGWSVGPIVSVNTGMPLNLTVNGNPSNSGTSGADRPNVIGDWHSADPTVQQWFNTAAFLANPKLTYGNAGRNILRGPGLFNLDLAAHKSFKITERVSAQLRLESFNATNTPALGSPNTVVGNPLFGQITTAGTPRDNQIGLKILF